MFLMILGALVAFTVIILFAANIVTSSVEEARGEDPRLRAAIVERIAPVGSVNVAGAPAASATAEEVAARSGEEIAAAACNACHVAGVLGAPKIGDAAVWNDRLAAGGGVDGLTTSAINGKGNMPARGGAQISDEEVRAAVVHMLEASGVAVAGTADAAPTDATPTNAEAAVEPAAAASPMGAAAQTAGAAMEAASDMLASAMPTPEPAAAAAPDLAKGKTIYDTACFACHTTGAAGAPRLGDAALWAPRIAKGMETLNHNVLNGIGAMPPKGGRVDLSDADVLAAAAWMIEQVK
jgi:cytochrome c5